MATTDDNPRVLISLLNWNSAGTTIACLETLAQIDYDNRAVVVIDNGSSDDSVARIGERFPDVEVICAGENLGYAAGNALALDVARREGAALLWILNPDALPALDTLSALVEAYRRCGDALYGSVPVYEAHGERRVMLKTWALGVDGRANGARPTRIEGRFDACFRTLEERAAGGLHGSSLLIPLAVIERHGFLDSSFFLYSEETDYSLRLWREGVPSYLVPRSVVMHHPAGAHKHNARLKPVILYYQTRNRLIVLRRYAGGWQFALRAGQHLLYALAWLALTPVRGGQSARAARFTVLGVWHALRGRMGKVYAPEAFR